MLSSQPHGPQATEPSDRKYFPARQVLNVSEQGSQYLGRSPFFTNTIVITTEDCLLYFVDIDVQQPITRCCWCDLVDLALIIMVS